jgi:TetR/AcrR family transcriptional regulator, transcriptional repressor for nem operon
VCIAHAAVNSYLLIDRHNIVSMKMAKTETSTTEKIIAAAERRMREGGFHGFSFREIAADVGIKSASVHHHFPTKEDLSAAVAEAYTDRFMAALGDPEDRSRSPKELIGHYAELFRRAIIEDGQMCLCGVLASEVPGLPPRVGVAARGFFEQNIAWLETVLKRKSPRARPNQVRLGALKVVALLEGAMLISGALQSQEVFELLAKSVQE